MTSLTLRGRRSPRVRRPDRRAVRSDATQAELGPLPQNWRTAFFDALAECSNVARACDKAGVSTSTVYDLKRRDLGFADRWQTALAEGYDNLEMELLDRLRNGEGGELRYNYAVAVRALQAHRATASKERGRRTTADSLEARASILRKLEQMREQVIAAEEAEGAAAASAGEALPDGVA